MSSETITKNDLKAILDAILPASTPTVSLEYVGDYGSTIFNGTWTAPDNGMIVLHASSSASTAYWYVRDNNLSNILVGCLYWAGGQSTHRTTSFPVIKGHTYETTNKTSITTANAYFYKFKVSYE